MSRTHRRVLPTAAAAGALWGGLAYTILWGNTSIVVTRRFVDSPLGLLSLFPVRVVLYAIHVVETRIVHHPFDFASNHDWIGLLAAAVGALLLALAAGALLAGRRWRGRRSRAAPRPG